MISLELCCFQSRSCRHVFVLWIYESVYLRGVTIIALHVSVCVMSPCDAAWVTICVVCSVTFWATVLCGMCSVCISSCADV